jgi:microsomal dipeptidase-like Zn-dependent dipeptidase
VKLLRRALAVLLVLGLAYVHWVLPDQVESSKNTVVPHDRYVISDRARTLHESLFIADLHSDSLLWKRDLSKRSGVGHMDLPRLREGNVALQVFSATTKAPEDMNFEQNTADSDQVTLLAVASFWPPRTWTSLYERAAFQLEKLRDLAERDGLTVITNRDDMQDFVARRERGEPVVGGVYLIEGAHPLEGEVANLDRLFDQGLRIVGLTHFFDNELGGSLHGVSREGLGEFGRAVVRRADELGMIVDVAHASPRMVADVLAVSSSPVILSHGGVSRACESPRNLPDALMQEIAEGGGLVGIGYFAGAVCDISPQGVVDAIRAAIDLLGVEHVALGSDYDGTVEVAFDTSELAILTGTMLANGFSEYEIRLVMGENVKRFLLANLPEG